MVLYSEGTCTARVWVVWVWSKVCGTKIKAICIHSCIVFITWSKLFKARCGYTGHRAVSKATLVSVRGSLCGLWLMTPLPPSFGNLSVLFNIFGQTHQEEEEENAQQPSLTPRLQSVDKAINVIVLILYHWDFVLSHKFCCSLYLSNWCTYSFFTSR